jgi:hypothetical protein
VWKKKPCGGLRSGESGKKTTDQRTAHSRSEEAHGVKWTESQECQGGG